MNEISFDFRKKVFDFLNGYCSSRQKHGVYGNDLRNSMFIAGMQFIYTGFINTNYIFDDIYELINGTIDQILN